MNFLFAVLATAIPIVLMECMMAWVAVALKGPKWHRPNLANFTITATMTLVSVLIYHLLTVTP